LGTKSKMMILRIYVAFLSADQTHYFLQNEMAEIVC